MWSYSDSTESVEALLSLRKQHRKRRGKGKSLCNCVVALECRTSSLLPKVKNCTGTKSTAFPVQSSSDSGETGRGRERKSKRGKPEVERE